MNYGYIEMSFGDGDKGSSVLRLSGYIVLDNF